MMAYFGEPEEGSVACQATWQLSEIVKLNCKRATYVCTLDNIASSFSQLVCDVDIKLKSPCELKQSRGQSRIWAMRTCTDLSFHMIRALGGFRIVWSVTIYYHLWGIGCSTWCAILWSHDRLWACRPQYSASCTTDALLHKAWVQKAIVTAWYAAAVSLLTGWVVMCT